ncbi:OmpP1/FadL family transporter [Afifella sp. IM 167]|uniref:OmpP1/FadL family transporter n=1 Tax=Afifella sp. IM 167 TaxID=2033586 RepID=UPI001CC91124|nr:OmpP1/FadL family transporter [Afifella sp. IM 167]MBZ8135296.1 hypothetical protein [Afifella sp. IM 167]
MQKFTRTLRGSVAAAALLAVIGASAAHAGGFALREQSAYGQGMSFAGVAAGGSLSSMFWNPATLSAVMGFQSETVATYIAPTSDVRITTPGVLAQSQGDVGENAILPSSYYGYRLNDHIVLGLGINAPFGLATKYPLNSALRGTVVPPGVNIAFAGTTEVFTMSANPAIAYQFNEYITVALGAVLQYADVRLTDQFLPGLGVSALDGADDFAFGLTAGIQVKPMEGTEIGLGYRSRINHEIDGPLRTAAGTFQVKGDGFNTPDTVTLGIRQRITDAFRLTAGVEWANWSHFKAVDLTGAPVPVSLGFNYNDSWFFALGGEYDFNEALTVRAGVARELAPIDDANRSFRLPDNDRWWLSAGASYKATERFSFDVGYSYIFADDTNILTAAAGGPAANSIFGGTSDADVHVFTAALKMKFGGPRHEAPVMANY